MATTTALLPIGNTDATSVPFTIEPNGSASLYLVPANGAILNSLDNVMIQRESSDGGRLVNCYSLTGVAGECILLGAGTFVAHRPAQTNAIGLDIVTA